MLTKEHPFFPQFCQLMTQAAASTPVYDLGTSQRFAKEVGLVREIFTPQSYKAGGYFPDMTLPEPCDLHCDLQSMDTIAAESVGSVICLSVLEHVADISSALKEIHRILKPGGIAILSAPFLWPYHGKSGRQENPVYCRESLLDQDHSHRGYGDFWRFTHQGLAHALSEAGFDRVDVWPVDGRIFARLGMLGLLRHFQRFPALMKFLAKLDQPKLGRTTSMHYALATKAKR